MDQLNIDHLIMESWFTSLPFDSEGQAIRYSNLFFKDWKNTKVIPKGNGWIICYKGSKGEQKMYIKRWVADFGNSTTQMMVDGNYFEMTSSVYEISQKESDAIFAQPISADDLLHNLVVCTEIEQKERYFKVGLKATQDILSSTHINKLHDKTESINVYMQWLGAIAYYHALQSPVDSEAAAHVKVDYFSTMLPTWIVKKADKFSIVLEKMANRFKGTHKVKLLTAGFQRDIEIEVIDAKCRIEGETARYALKRNLDLNIKDTAAQYDDVRAVISDLGGQTHDLSRLGKGLRRPASSDDFESFTDQSFLKTLEILRNNKLMTHFKHVHDLEGFIADNINKERFIYTDPVTLEPMDLTDPIITTLKSFARISAQKVIMTFEFKNGEKVKYIHIGGISQLLKKYILEALHELIGEAAALHHIFPDDSRMLNIYGLEIVAKDDLNKKEQVKVDAEEATTV